MKPTPSKPRHTFTEYTYTDGENEVMAHHRAKDDKIVALYTYAKNAPSFNDGNDSTINGRPIKPLAWKPGKNPLFVHLSGAPMRRFVREFIDSGALICTERED